MTRALREGVKKTPTFYGHVRKRLDRPLPFTDMSVISRLREPKPGLVYFTERGSIQLFTHKVDDVSSTKEENC